MKVNARQALDIAENERRLRADARHALADAREALTHTRRQLEETRAETAQYAVDAASADRRAQAARDELERELRERLEMARELERLRGRLERQKAETSSVRERLVEARRQTSPRAKRKIAKHRAVTASARATAGAETARRVRAEREAAEARALLERRLDEARAQAAADLAAERAESQDRLLAATTELERRLDATRADLEGRLDGARANADRHARTATERSAALEESRRELLWLRAHLEEVEAAAREIEANATSAARELQARIEAACAERDRARADREAVAVRLEEMRRELSDHDRTKNDALEQLAATGHQVERVESELAASRAQAAGQAADVRHLTEQLDQAGTDAAWLRSRLEAAESTMDELRGTIETTESARAELAQRLEAAGATRDERERTHSAELDTLATELERSREEGAWLREQLRAAQAGLAAASSAADERDPEPEPEAVPEAVPEPTAAQEPDTEPDAEEESLEPAAEVARPEPRRNGASADPVPVAAIAVREPWRPGEADLRSTLGPFRGMLARRAVGALLASLRDGEGIYGVSTGRLEGEACLVAVNEHGLRTVSLRKLECDDIPYACVKWTAPGRTAARRPVLHVSTASGELVVSGPEEQQSLIYESLRNGLWRAHLGTAS